IRAERLLAFSLFGSWLHRSGWEMSKAFMLYFCARAVNGMAALATVMLLTRVMTVEAYGKYSLLLSFVVTGAAFFYQWIALAVARFLPGEVNRDKIYSAVLVFYLSASIFLFFIVLGYVF